MDTLNREISESNPLFMDLHEDTSQVCEDSPNVNKLVRKCYFEYIKKMLLTNIEQCRPEYFVTYNLPDTFLIQYAQQIELNALRTCMASNIYRLAMLNEINKIKTLTTRNILFANSIIHVDNFKQNLDSSLSSDENFEHLNGCNDQYNNDEIVEIKQEHNNMHLADNENDTECITNDNIEHKDCNLSKDKIESNNESVYNEILQQMKEMFECPEENAMCEDIGKNSPFSEIFDEAFCTKDYKFWNYEFQNYNSFLKQQLASIYELNPEKYIKIMTKIADTFGDDCAILEQTSFSLKKFTYICKQRISFHMRNSLSTFYKRKQFRSADEFRILVKSLVLKIIQIDPYIDYKLIYQGIDHVFREKQAFVGNISDIQEIVTLTFNYISSLVNKSL